MKRKKTRRSKPAWSKETPIEEGFYWYRDDERGPVVLRVFDPLGNGHWKAWDWFQGRLMLCAIAGYEGEWYGPMEAPK